MGISSNTSPRRLARLACLFLTLASITHVEAQTDAGQAPPKRYACPGDANAEHTTGGITFRLKCDHGTTAKRIDTTQTKSLNACADLCAELPECQSADWSPITKNCGRFSEYIPTIPMANVHTWFPIEERIQAPMQIEFDEPQCPKIPDPIVERYGKQPEITTMGVLCPDYDGKTYLSKDGTYFQVKCLHQSTTLDPLFSLPAAHLGECLSICANTDTCKSATFLPQKYKCQLYTSGGEVIVSTESSSTTYNSGYVIDPPSYEVEDIITERCTKACPHAHGETFEEDGQAFRISCCRRHGVKHFGSEPDVPSLAACTTLCSRLSACISADYHEQSRTCYFGKHSGEPAVSAPGWSSVYSLGCAGRCKEKKASGACCGGASGTQKPEDEL